MADRFRLNLEAPFLQATGNPRRPEPTGDTGGFQRPANDLPPQAAKPAFDTDRHLRRPPVPQRGQADHDGHTMSRYINGLEARLVDHMRRHAPRWHAQETRRVLRRWSIPGANHPAPSWATPRDVLTEARDYAAALLRDRLVAKMNRIGSIRIARTLGSHSEVDPLHLIFHNRSTVPSPSNAQGIRRKI